MITILLIIAIFWLMFSKDVLQIFKSGDSNKHNRFEHAVNKSVNLIPILKIVSFFTLLIFLGAGLSIEIDRQILNYVFKVDLPKFKDMK